MIKHLLLICSISMPLHIDAMKRLCPHNDEGRSTKRPCITHNVYLPTDMQMVIFDKCTENKGKLRSVVATINTFARTNTHFYKLYNDQQFIDNLIEMLSKNFYCSHETVARVLHTQGKNRLILQERLQSLCLNRRSYRRHEKIFSQNLDSLIKQGANLEFTYNHDYQPKTILMISYEESINPYRSLFEKKVNFNQKTPQNKTLLMMLTQYPICYQNAKKIISHPHVNIDEENNRGETALLKSIKNRKKHTLTNVFIITIKKLLEAGADPKKTDRNGNTPLSIANELNDTDAAGKKNEIIQLIQDAITKQSQLI